MFGWNDLCSPLDQLGSKNRFVVVVVVVVAVAAGVTQTKGYRVQGVL